MSIITMFRRCERCGKKYTYNPSTGDFGIICPKCGKIQENRYGIAGKLLDCLKKN